MTLWRTFCSTAHTTRLHGRAGCWLPIVVEGFPSAFSTQSAHFGKSAGRILPFMQAQEARQLDNAQMIQAVADYRTSWIPAVSIQSLHL